MTTDDETNAQRHGFVALDHAAVLQEICRLSGKPGMWLSIEQDTLEGRSDLLDHGTDRLRPAPYVTGHDLGVTGTRDLWLLFESQEQLDVAYEATVGKDGPTESNPYDGPARIYALSCDATGRLQRENA